MTKYLYIYKEDHLLIRLEGEELKVPSSDQTDLKPESQTDGFLFHQEADAIHLMVEAGEDFEIPQGYAFSTLRDIRDCYGQYFYSMALRSYQLHNWRRKHRFCGVCGTAFGKMNPDRSLSCPSCGNLLFPQTSNAVITAILKDDRILLAHNTNFPEGLYSLIAGFVEMGESFEDAVHREIYEEVGIRVKNVRYFDNQEWPFPNSTMIGFFADYDSGEIAVDGDEIIEARWYTPEEFPVLPSRYSIARRLIEDYRDRYNRNHNKAQGLY